MFGLACACFGLNGALVVFFIDMFCRVLVAVAFACGLLAVVLFIGVFSRMFVPVAMLSLA